VLLPLLPLLLLLPPPGDLETLPQAGALALAALLFTLDERLGEEKEEDSKGAVSFLAAVGAANALVDNAAAPNAGPLVVSPAAALGDKLTLQALSNERTALAKVVTAIRASKRLGSPSLDLHATTRLLNASLPSGKPRKWASTFSWRKDREE